ncbi:hypothetical protein OSB04_007581 [Centaurea solstitialis]|uniref:Reverse transcriptase domain-containing protein n=1 Tax=Centaurea solstitialis TaxID=347529 RepID=A0AA38TVN0_9ASTR|nr:hypothetical protein OSB04_007581 [Centaurea solstitialis]
MLERLAKHAYFCYLDSYSGFFQILVHPNDQEKTTFTCPYGTFAYRFMPFGLCNAPATFQRCVMAIFSNFIERTMEVLMDDFSVHGANFDTRLSNLTEILHRCWKQGSVQSPPVPGLLPPVHGHCHPGKQCRVNCYVVVDEESH